MWEEYAKDPQQTYMNFMFDLEDSSGKSRKHVLIFQRFYSMLVTRAYDGNLLCICSEIPEILM